MSSASTSATRRIAEVFHVERKRLLDTVRRRLFDFSPDDAEDLVQDVFHNILKRGDLVGQVENLTAYVYQAVSNRILDHRRRPSREVPLEPDEEPGDDLLRRALEPVEPGLDPEQQMQRKQLRAVLRDALEELTPAERDIWIATELEGRTFREVSEESGAPMGTLLSRKSRAGKVLRARLEQTRKDENV